jgi:hypothetical protein
MSEGSAVAQQRCRAVRCPTVPIGPSQTRPRAAAQRVEDADIGRCCGGLHLSGDRKWHDPTLIAHQGAATVRLIADEDAGLPAQVRAPEIRGSAFDLPLRARWSVPGRGRSRRRPADARDDAQCMDENIARLMRYEAGENGPKPRDVLGRARRPAPVAARYRSDRGRRLGAG